MKKYLKTTWIIILCLMPYLGINTSAQTKFTWGKQFGSNQDDQSYTVTNDRSGNVYIAGSTTGILSDHNFGSTDAFVTKLDSSGNVIWTKQFGTNGNDNIIRMVSDTSGNIYATGSTSGNLGVHQYGNDDVMVVKLDSTGAIIWKKQFGTSGKDVGNAIYVNDSGYIFVAGETNALFGDSLLGKTDGFVLKLDNTGNKVGIYQFGTPMDEGCTGIVGDTASNIFVCGSTFGDLAAKNKGQDDAYYIKLSDQLKPISKVQFGSNSYDSYIKIAIDDDGNIYIGGSTNGDLGNKQLGQGDAFLTKINKSGEIIWTNQFGTNKWDGIHGIMLNSKVTDNIVVSGCQNWPNCQSFIRVFRKDGKLVGIQNCAHIENTGGTCGQTVILDNNGEIYHTGMTSESLFNPFKGGAHDIFLLKLKLEKSITQLYVNSPIKNENVVKEVAFSFTFPDTAFVTDDADKTMTYTVSTGNGNLVPSWMNFESETRTFSGIPTETGVFTIKVTASDHSKSTSSNIFMVTVSANHVGIDKSTGQRVTVSPNPTNDKVKISFGSASYGKAVISICNIEGKQIYLEAFSNIESANIDLTDHPSGIYLAKIFIGDEVIGQEICLK
jgi:hypothetical protein